jgi:hypothetical protein
VWELRLSPPAGSVRARVHACARVSVCMCVCVCSVRACVRVHAVRQRMYKELSALLVSIWMMSLEFKRLGRKVNSVALVWKSGNKP